MIISKWLTSAKHALRGLRCLFINERNARIHLFLACLTLGIGYFLHLSITEWCLVILCISFVIALEAVNSAIERAVDLVTPDWHPLAKDAKDLAAAGALLISLGAAVVGAIIFIPKLITLFTLG